MVYNAGMGLCVEPGPPAKYLFCFGIPRSIFLVLLGVSDPGLHKRIGFVDGELLKGLVVLCGNLVAGIVRPPFPCHQVHCGRLF